VVGAIYAYTGPDLSAPTSTDEGDDPLDLTGVNYSTGTWTKVAEHSVYDSSAGEVDIATNDIIQVNRGYTVLHTSNGTGEDDVNLTTNKTFVQVGSDYDFATHPDVRSGATYKVHRHDQQEQPRSVD